MIEEERIPMPDCTLCGYDTLVIKPEIVAIEGPNVPPLRKGMIVNLRDSDVPSGFVQGQSATVIGFRKPFDNKGSTDYIVALSDGVNVEFVKISHIARVPVLGSDRLLDLLCMLPAGDRTSR